MTVQEFNNQFEVLYNNITSNQAPGLDTYEKSVFLTKAQDEIVKNYFFPTTNENQLGFDGSPKRQVDFSTLIRTKIVESANRVNNTYTFSLGEINALCYLNERVEDDNQITYVITPLNYLDYDRLQTKPYPFPHKKQFWRVFVGNSSIKLIGITSTNSPHIKYELRYVEKPQPIILEDLGDLTINGESTARTSLLPEEIHEEILQRAVELAKTAWVGDLTAELKVGERSE